MVTLKGSVPIFYLFLLCTAIPVAGGISNDDYNTILALANSMNSPDVRIVAIGIDQSTNALQITYYPAYINPESLGSLTAFYLAVQKNFPDINGCIYIGVDNNGDIINTMNSRVEWYNELIWSNDYPTQESLARFIIQTQNTLYSYRQVESEPLQNTYISTPNSASNPSSDCMKICEDYNRMQTERNEWRLEHDQIEWPLKNCLQECG